MNYKLAVFLAFVIFTPVLILLSWVLLILVDDPFKDFAYEIDIVSRMNRPAAKSTGGNTNKGIIPAEDDPNFTRFIKNSWKVFGLTLYFVCLFIVTESYQAYANNESDQNYNNIENK